MGCCHPDTKKCRSDTPEVISKLIRVKFAKSINYSTFVLGKTKLCNMRRGGRKFKVFFSGEGFYRLDFYGGTIQG